ncbi:UNVERIFIED_ORG: hypothetical protein GGE64_005049 [Rhizobium etli]
MLAELGGLSMRKFLATCAISAALFTIPGLAQPVAAEDIGDWIKQRCTSEWPGDYSMQVYCIRKQIEGAQEIGRLARGEASNGDLRGILSTCLSEWGGDAKNADWPMISYCYRKQREAWQTMKKL